ncbi:MAG TPA: helix-turn-helix domain-containing protein, partial [Candidatus Tectomicrobia bacterium]|nr:helix-turn-helix domain-containing protein [Candidatus Tectomicrobia bacterium]
HFFQCPTTPGEDAMGQKTDIPVPLDDHARVTLAGWLRRSKTPMGLAKRAQALLLLDEGVPYATTARRVGLSERHVRKWAYRFLAEGLAGLLDKQRPGRMPRVSPRRRG